MEKSLFILKPKNVLFLKKKQHYVVLKILKYVDLLIERW